MGKLRCAVLIIISFIISNVVSAQHSHSIQINGGLVMPNSSSNGFNASIQYNYQFNNDIQFYIYSGYSSWDKYNVNFTEEWSTVQKKTNFNTYIADEHVLIPIYIGSRINLQTNKYLTSFVSLEAGYSHFSYNNYSVKKTIDPITGTVLDYYADKNSRNEIKENLFGLGAGAGISHPLTESMNVMLTFKLNSNFNSKYYSFLSSKGTYTALNLGINFNI